MHHQDRAPFHGQPREGALQQDPVAVVVEALIRRNLLIDSGPADAAIEV